jgi:A/G-specific adenine glycosylase
LDQLAQRLLDWFDVHGRHDLPWQKNACPYSIWVSEIMLQQTQVATVLAYYDRFIARFPTVRALAAAELDDVLGSWAGLGYYARARNLHRAARTVVEEFHGELPTTLDELMMLPGIGRSTAGAILALSRGERVPILDGNAKRVLARYHAIEGWPGEPAVARELWAVAELHTPSRRVAHYTQAIMDLGATLCTKHRPACTVCPLSNECRACRSGRQAQLPASRPARARPHRRVAALLIVDAQRRVLLERRPEHGIWGGLFSLPEIGIEDSAAEWCAQRLGVSPPSETPLAPIAHAFTHFDLDIEPRLVTLGSESAAVMDRDDWLWYNPEDRSLRVGLPAPIEALLRSLRNEPRNGKASRNEDRRRIA